MIPHFVILGGGISGLALCWFLQQTYGDSIKLTLLEKEEYLGGWIQTVHSQGFLFEQGPRSCRTSSSLETLQLIEQLHLQEEVIPADPAAAIRYLYLNGRLQVLPKNWLSCLYSPFIYLFGKAIWRDWHALSELEDESIADFATRRFGKKLADQFIDPLTAGIYAGCSTQLSIQSCFPQLKEWERQYDSVCRGAFYSKKKSTETLTPFVKQMQRSPLISFKKGMKTFIHSLAKQSKADIKLRSEVCYLQFNQNHAEIKLTSGDSLHADRVISTLPAPALASLILPHSSSIAQRLNSIPYSSVAVVNMGYRQSVWKKRGYGYLIPAQEQQEALGVVWDSHVFPQQADLPHATCVTVMIGDCRLPHFHALNEEHFAAIAMQTLKNHMQIEAKPDAVSTRIAYKAIPQYNIGYANIIEKLKRDLALISPCFSTIGPLFGGVSINACIVQAKELANSFVNFVQLRY